MRYQFRAPAEVTSAELEVFLQRVGREAQRIGFAATAVVHVQFDTAERVRVARWLLGGRPVACEHSTRPKPLDIMRYMTKDDVTLPPPLGGVLLIVANDSGDEACFGFMRYPESIQTVDSSVVVESGLGRTWFFEDSVESSEPRYRALLQMFVEAGFPTEVYDELADGTSRRLSNL